MYDILLVEDDRDLSTISQIHLTHAGHRVDTAFTCAEAEDHLSHNTYDLILLDIMLPDRSGDELCRSIRQFSTCPIIFMSCLDDSTTIVDALKSGGDDYMVKPIRYPELLARMDAVIRRSRNMAQTESNLRVFHSFSLDTAQHRILRGDEVVELSPIEHALLLYMTEHQDALLLYQDLYQRIWGSDSLGDVRTVMVHISNLRKKLDCEQRGIITTVRGAGYIFNDI